MNPADMPIFNRTFDLLTWLVPVTNHFPRSCRHSFTARVLGHAFLLREHLEKANARRGQQRLVYLTRADDALRIVRVYIRLAVTWKWLSSGQYEHVAEMLNDIGRLLGSWMKSTRTS